MDDVIYSPTIVQTVAGVGQIEFRYLSSRHMGNTIVQLTPTFITEQVKIETFKATLQVSKLLAHNVVCRKLVPI